MSTSPLSLLDQAELLQLALNASAANDSGNAIAYLKEAVSRADASAVAHYVLGAEYAQSKLYEKAMAEMEQALVLDADMAIARLQLGMLYLSSAMVDKAFLTLKGLFELPPEQPLHLFAKGLCHLARDEFIDATACLQQGMAANDSNQALNGDMQKILNGIYALLNQGDAAVSGAPVVPLAQAVGADKTAEDSDAQHILLSAYTRGTTH